MLARRHKSASARLILSPFNDVHVCVPADIQEFYEITLLNTQKSCEQKLEEVNHMVDKWEKCVSVQHSELGIPASPVEEVSIRVSL